jgi:ADP-ribose pyrophosphatase YjhB (NUDIX family)
MSKHLTDKEFKEIYSRVPRLSAEVVLRSKDGVVLSLRNLDSYKGQWHIPGGSVRHKEHLTDAIKRVAKQELGVSVKIIKLLGYIEYPSAEKEYGFASWPVGIAFLCESESDNFILDEQANKVESFKEIPENTISEQKEFLIKHWEEILI